MKLELGQGVSAGTQLISLKSNDGQPRAHLLHAVSLSKLKRRTILVALSSIVLIKHVA